MAKLPENDHCALSGTRYCALLNAHACEACPIDGNLDSAEDIMDDLDLYEQLLPAGGVARLFLSEECQTCRRKPAGRRRGYAILYMAHPGPKRIQRKLFRGRKGVGTMIPLQLAICSKCRRSYMAIGYGPMLGIVTLGILGLIPMLIRDVRFYLAGIAQWVPFAVWATLMLLGCIVGKIVSVLIRRKASERMYVNILDHPFLREMMARAWVPVGRNPSHPDVVFSKSRKIRGLGTALPEDTD